MTTTEQRIEHEDLEREDRRQWQEHLQLGSLGDRYSTYLEHTSEAHPKSFDEWLGM